MTTLKASVATRQSLERRKLRARLDVVGGRASALPQLNLGGLLSGAENRLNLLQFAACADLLDDVDQRIERHMEALRSADMEAAAVAQAQHLEQHQGVSTFKAGDVRSRDGWVWLKTRDGRLTSDQISTGDRISSLYSLAHRDGLSSSSNDNGGGGERDPIEARLKAQEALGRVCRHIEYATGSTRLTDLLLTVCGRGESLRALAGSEDRKAGAYEVELRLALDMAGVAFKMGAKREEAA